MAKPIVYSGCVDRWNRDPVFRTQMIQENKYSLDDTKELDRIGNESNDDRQ